MGAIFDSLVGSRPVAEEKLPTAENLGEFSKGLGRGFHGLRGTLLDFAGTVTEPIAPDTARKFYSYSDAAQQDAAQYPGRVTSLKDIHNLSDFGDFAAGGAGQALPSLLASVGMGGPVGVGLRAAGAGLGAATVGGLAAGSYPAVTGELAGSMRRDPTIMSDYTPAQRTGMALAGGVPLAAIDALPTARAVGKVIGPNLVNKGVKNAVLNTLKSGFQTGVEEGVAEGTQQAGQIAMLGAMNPERKSFDLQETADAFALGFFGGGVPLGSAAGAAQAIKSNLPGAVNKASDYLKSRRPATTEQELTQRDMADVGEAEALAGRILEADAPGSVRRLTEEFMSMAKRTGEDAELYLREVGNRFAASDAYEKGRVAAKALREKLFPGRDRRLGMAMFGDIKYDDPPATQSFRPGVDAPYYNRYAPDEVSPRGFGVEPDVEPLLSYLRAKDFVSGVSKNLGGETKYWQDVADYLVNQAEWDSADNSLLSSMQEWIGSKFGAVLSKNETGEMIVPDERLVKAVEGFSDKMKFTYEAMKLGGQSVPSQAAFDEVYNIVKSYESAEDMQMQQGKKETYDEESSDDIGTNEFEPNELQTEDVYIGKSEFADVPFESIGNKVKIKELQDNIRGSGGLARTIGVWDKAKRQAKDDADLRRREDELLKKYRKEPFTDREEALLDVNSKFVYLLDQRVNRPEGTVVRGEEFNNVSSKNNKWSVQAKNFPGPEHGTVWFKRKDGVEFATSVSKLIALGRKGSVTGETEGLAEQRDALLTGISSFLTAENADGSAALQGVYGFKEGADISWTDISKAANASSADFSLRKGGGKSLATMVRGGAGYLPASLKLFDGTVADIEQAKVRKTKYAVGSRDEKSAKKYIDYVTKKFETKDQNRKAYEEFIKESPTFKQELAAYGNEKDATAAVKRREKEAHGLIKTGALSQGQEALLNKLKAATSTSEAFKLAMQLNIEGSARRTVDYARSLGYEQEAATLEDLLGTENWGKVGAELDNLSELLAKAGFNKEENEGVSDLTKITEDKHPIRSLREDLTKPNKAMGERDASGEIARPAPTGELATGPKIDVVPKVGKSVKQYAAERLAAAQRLFGDKSWGDEKGKQWLLDEMVRLNKLYESASDEVFTEKTTKEESEGIPKANEARLAERKPAEPKGEPLPTPEQSYGLLHKEDDTDSKIKQSLEKLGFTNVRPLIGSNYRKLKDVRTDKAIDGVFVYDKGNGVNYSIASRDKLIVGLRSDTITAENYTDAVKKLYAEPAKSAEPAKAAEPVKNFSSLPSYQKGQRTMAYAGVGSRKTPAPIQVFMKNYAKRLEALGYTLRSGGAEGADSAFESGVESKKEIFYAKDANNITRAIAKEIHPNPNALGNGIGLNLMARNTNQLFGRNLDTPVDFVIAWTPDGAESSAERSRATGGTGQAIDMASRKGIPVFNLAKEDGRARFEAFMKEKVGAGTSKTEPAKSADSPLLVVKNLNGVSAVNAAEKAGKGVSTLRKQGTNEHYGNPFTLHTPKTGEVGVKTVKEAVSRYSAWLRGTADKNVKPEQRTWILSQIDKGALDGKTLLYYTQLNEPSHADALAEFVNEHRQPANTTQQKDYAIAGMQYVEGLTAARAQKYLTVGRDITFRREPNNPKDKNAVQVYTGQQRIGYVPKELAKTLAPRLDAGEPLSGVITGWENGYARFAMRDRLGNAMAADIHRDLGKEGFAATHDSPIRHEGKFDWRKHIGKGEGNAAFGAGTYLSTANDVHKNYKNQFTSELMGESRFKGLIADTVMQALNTAKEIAPKATTDVWLASALRTLELNSEGTDANAILSRKGAEDLRKNQGVYRKALTTVSPTYHVTVNAKPEEIMDWDAPLSEQSELVKKAAEKAIWKLPYSENRADYVADMMRNWDGAAFYESIATNLGANGYADYTKASDYLQSLGIVGHKYAAAGGRNNKHPNYVIYDDSRIETNFVQFSGIQDNLGSPLTEAEQKEIKEHIEKLLGPKINTSFVEEVLGKLGGKAVNFSADWGPGVIRIMSRLTFGSAMDAANHESMHELFNLLRNEPAAKPLMDILLKAANAAPVVKQLERLLERHPAAMRQIHDKSPEFENERLAYMFQFWQAGKLVIGSETKSVFQKIRDWIRKVVGLLSEDQKAELIFRRFAEGQLGWGMAENPSEVAKILADDIQSRGTAIKKIGEWTRPAYNALSKLAFTAQGQLEDSNNPVLKKVSRMFNVPTGESGDQGMYEARAQMSSKFLNRFENDIAGASKADLALALEYLQKEDGSIPRAEEARKVFLAVRKLLDDLHPYITQSGIERFNAETNKWETIPYRKNYFPVVYDMEKIAEDPSAFVKDLVDNHSDYIQERLKELKFDRWNEPARHEEYARAVVNRLLNSQGAVELDETTWSLGFSPLMTAVNKRSLDWIKPEIRSKYQNKDLVGTMTSYIMQSVKRAEYVRRFGNDGDKLRDLIVDAKDAEVARMARERSGGKAIHKVSKEEWKEMEDKAAEIIKKYHPAIMALEGTLGYDINPTLRELSAGMMVYQNFRILVTSLFSSLIDPLGIMVRGGTAKNAYDTFIRGVKEVGLRWKGEKSKDEATKLAEMMGTVDAGTFLEALGQTYSSLYMYGKVKRWNDWLFKINGMEAWTRATRVGATQAAIEFIQKHMATPTDNSKRWLDELFGENQRPVLVDGKLDTTDKKVQMAVMKWVDGAILRPNAAQRPSWASDPHWALVWHMKQFTYTFHKVILERVWNEAYKHGNIEPMMLLMATYIPMMIAADAAKALLITGDEPYWMKEGLSGQISHGAVRANLMGIPQLPLEAYNKDVAQIAGPSAEWVKDWVTEPAGEQALGSLPFGSVVRQWG